MYDKSTNFLKINSIFGEDFQPDLKDHDKRLVWANRWRSFYFLWNELKALNNNSFQ